MPDPPLEANQLSFDGKKEIGVGVERHLSQPSLHCLLLGGGLLRIEEISSDRTLRRIAP